MDWKRIGKRLLNPPVWLTVLLVPVSAAALYAVFGLGWSDTPFAYGTYVLSAFTLTAATAVCIRQGRTRCRHVKRRIVETKYGGRYFSDLGFRTRQKLGLSLAFNLLYVAAHLYSGIRFRSVWSITLAAYYSILALVRTLLLRQAGRSGAKADRRTALRRYRRCGAILMALNLTLSGMVVLVIQQGRSFVYEENVMIYAMAAYTFYVTITSAVSIVKYWKSSDPLLSAVTAVKLSAALVSMLALETAMLSAFGADMAAEDRLVLIAATGAGVCAVVVAMASYMIVRSTAALRDLEAAGTAPEKERTDHGA